MDAFTIRIRVDLFIQIHMYMSVRMYGRSELLYVLVICVTILARGAWLVVYTPANKFGSLINEIKCMPFLYSPRVLSYFSIIPIPSVRSTTWYQLLKRKSVFVLWLALNFKKPFMKSTFIDLMVPLLLHLPSVRDIHKTSYRWRHSTHRTEFLSDQDLYTSEQENII